MKLAKILILIGLCAGLRGAWAQAAVVLVGHAGVPRLDIQIVQRLYTGRAIEVAGNPIVVVNLAPGNPLRERFMASVMNEGDDKYIAYWTVRRHIGKGTPPRELGSDAEVVSFIQNTPGAIGYIAESEVRPGMNIVLRP